MSTATIIKELEALNAAGIASRPGSREAMLITARRLVASLQTPSDFISHTLWAEPALAACLRAAVDIGLFEALAESGETASTVQHLAQATKVESALLARMLRHLGTFGVVHEATEGEWSSTALSRSFTEPKYRDGIIYCYDVAGPSFRELPDFLKSTSYAEPLNPVKGPFQHAHKTDLHFFPWLGEHVKYLTAFGNYMMGYRQGKLAWSDPGFFPVESKLASAKDGIVLVDVGGGKGHDLMDLQAKFPAFKGRLILQDKPEVIAEAKSDLAGDIDAQGHDFFTEQPVRGARAYYLHSILHDWDDASCIKILEALRPAMSSSSMLLVNELIVPDKGAAWSVTSMDWLMMALGSVRERTEADFLRLLTAAGYTVARVWTVEQGTESLIEAYVKA